jgi:hypothetical protein
MLLLCFLTQVDSSTLALHLWPPEAMEGVPEPPAPSSPFWVAAGDVIPAAATTPAVAAAAAAAVANAAASTAAAAATEACVTAAAEAGANGDGSGCKGGLEGPESICGSGLQTKSAAAAGTAAAAAGTRAAAGTGTQPATAMDTSAAARRKRSCEGVTDGGEAAGGPVLKKRKSVAGKKRTVWLGPFLLAYPDGRVLIASRLTDSSVDTLSLPQDVAEVCYGCPAKDLPVTVQLKAPGGAAAGLVRQSFTKAAAAAAFRSPSATAGTAAAATYNDDDDKDDDDGDAHDGSGVCPGCELVVVREFTAVVGRGASSWLLVRLTSHMKPFVGWRLFGIEAVSMMGLRRKGDVCNGGCLTCMCIVG